MSFYIKSLFFAIPIFTILIIIEALIAKQKGLQFNRAADVIASLSSGLTKTIRDGIKFGFTIIGYSWLVNHMTIYKLEPVWLAVILAFLVQDFTGYCIHRLKHLYLLDHYLAFSILVEKPMFHLDVYNHNLYQTKILVQSQLI